MKTVTFDDEAYDLLRGAKASPRESFSRVVKRLMGGRHDLQASAGAWRDMGRSERDALRRESVKAFGTTR
ncbi:MAG TPA: antitoxin VapB family protein [Candidatus Thermoplasmatota archaeon]|nr:antitoxin VapB family protein [Candidatus Thermoplasmatota archaeon]